MSRPALPVPSASSGARLRLMGGVAALHGVRSPTLEGGGSERLKKVCSGGADILLSIEVINNAVLHTAITIF